MYVLVEKYEKLSQLSQYAHLSEALAFCCHREDYHSILSLFEAVADTNIALKSVYDCCLSDFVLDYYLSLLPLTKLIDISVFIQLEQ